MGYVALFSMDWEIKSNSGELLIHHELGKRTIILIKCEEYGYSSFYATFAELKKLQSIINEIIDNET